MIVGLGSPVQQFNAGGKHEPGRIDGDDYRDQDLNQPDLTKRSLPPQSSWLLIVRLPRPPEPEMRERPLDLLGMDDPR